MLLSKPNILFIYSIVSSFKSNYVKSVPKYSLPILGPYLHTLMEQGLPLSLSFYLFPLSLSLSFSVPSPCLFLSLPALVLVSGMLLPVGFNADGSGSCCDNG